MEIGIDDFDEFDENYTTTQNIEDDSDGYVEPSLDSNEEPAIESDTDENDLITELLRSRGIEDKTKIKFQDEDGDINEVDWESLSNQDKLNILQSSDEDTGLDSYEIQLVNAVRRSNLTPKEYIEAVQRDAVERYIQSQSQQPVYKVDQISDDELFISDLISRTPDMTDEEALDVLERTKSNEALYDKQIKALRSEYQRLEDEQTQYASIQQQQAAQDQFNKFAEGIENSILNFTEFSGCDINMDQEDMQELYDFITGFDSAGISHFGKALNDPNLLVRMAWFALNGEQMINDINEYYKKEIANVRKESYNKGLQKSKDNNKVVYKQHEKKNINNEIFEDFE